MADLKSVLPFFTVTVLLIFCYAVTSISATFTSDGLHNFQSSHFSIIDEIHDDADLSISTSSTIETIYQFGDSISDTGNFIREHPNSNFANLPYGESFFHQPTGRCSNGLLIIDYISKFYNLPFLDPYLNKHGNFSHGVNFAVAGATALNASTLAMKHSLSCTTNSSLLVQLDWFKTHLNSICSDASECKKKLGKALIMMGEIGGNDYNWAFFQGKPIKEIYKLVPEVIHVVKYVIKEVISLGATRVIVPGNFPIGCMAVYLEAFKTNDARMYDELQCLKSLNNFAEFQNDRIQEAIGEIQTDHPDVSIQYADYFSALKEILQHATSFGFDKDIMQTPCCGLSNHEAHLNSGIECGRKGTIVCKDPYKHLSWDGMHLTQHGYQIMAELLIKRINTFGISNTV
ncbi:hypothetical protein BVRB_8g199460 [Beta vulgaris subsp. vulgaris]|uniref:GDSL esterase/lipase At1g28610 n=1 Tax=Beta vulgaris subsp. vulgaris TaxID=3555 RepID=UPI00053F2B94|nr:GDSL esterase/lipase At1g28610 [Beta vulgaris subsp. vulgaris]KMS96870.1 hypothetical protein BVRB_8g199460 [Beta vulgaris subsp. vulgaris]